MITMADHPFTCDGQQATRLVEVDTTTGHAFYGEPMVDHSADRLQQRTLEACATAHLLSDQPFTTIEVEYFGYDPDPNDRPDWAGQYNPTTDSIDWSKP